MRLGLLIDKPVQLLFHRCVALCTMGRVGGGVDFIHVALDEGRCQPSAIIIEIIMVILRIIIEHKHRC